MNAQRVYKLSCIYFSIVMVDKTKKESFWAWYLGFYTL